MSRPKDIFNAFYNRLESLENSRLINKVVKTGVEPIAIDEYNAIEVSLGNDVRSEEDKFQYSHQISINVDIHVKSSDTSLDDLMLDVRELVEQTVFGVPFALEYIYRVNFVSQSDPLYNEPGTDYRSLTRLEFMIEYFTPHEKC